jgi:hypothetical protein
MYTKRVKKKPIKGEKKRQDGNSLLGRVFGKGLCTVVQRRDDSVTFLDSQSCVFFSELTRLMITETKLTTDVTMYSKESETLVRRKP